MDVIFVDHESNLTFRNGNVDTSAFLADGIHLSASGVDRVLSNLSLPKQTSRKTVKRQRHESTRQSAIRVDEAARGSTARISRDPRPVNERHQHQQRQRHVRRSTDRDDTPQPTLDDTQRNDNEWRVVSRRRSTQDRRTLGQCVKCGETNHVTASTTSDWTVVGRRSVPHPLGRRSVPTPIGRRSVPTPIGRRSVPNLRHTPGQCTKCGETNHVSATCRHTQKVVCRKCGKSGHKDKHHSRD